MLAAAPLALTKGYSLVGQVVKASVSRAVDPEVDSRFPRRDFSESSHAFAFTLTYPVVWLTVGALLPPLLAVLSFPQYDVHSRPVHSHTGHTSDLKLTLQWLPCKAPGDVGSALGLVGPVSVYCDWLREKI